MSGLLRPGMSVEPTIDTKPGDVEHAPRIETATRWRAPLQWRVVLALPHRMTRHGVTRPQQSEPALRSQ